MTFREEKRNLFGVPQGYYLAHCISADYALGAGIAVQFDSIYNMRAKLRTFYANDNNVGFAALVDNVFNLITKERGYGKPTYDSLEETLYSMKDQMADMMITKLAIPRIGCKLDRLDWAIVSEKVKEVFADTDVEILVCYIDD